jgi:hypothetical protein
MEPLASFDHDRVYERVIGPLGVMACLMVLIWLSVDGWRAWALSAGAGLMCSLLAYGRRHGERLSLYPDRIVASRGPVSQTIMLSDITRIGLDPISRQWVDVRTAQDWLAVRDLSDRSEHFRHQLGAQLLRQGRADVVDTRSRDLVGLDEPLSH